MGCHLYFTTARTMILQKGSIGALLKLTKTTLGNPVNGIGANYISRILGILMYYDLINQLYKHFNEISILKRKSNLDLYLIPC